MKKTIMYIMLIITVVSAINSAALMISLANPVAVYVSWLMFLIGAFVTVELKVMRN